MYEQCHKCSWHVPGIWFCAGAIVPMTEHKSWHHMVHWVTSPYTFNDTTEGCNRYSSFIFVSIKVKWFGCTKKMMESLQGFFFRLISFTLKAKEGQVAILVYHRRRCALVHGTMNKSCENRRSDSSRETLMPLKNCSIPAKGEKKTYLGVMRGLNENSQKVAVLRKACWLCDYTSPEKAQRFAKSRKDKRGKRKLEGARESNSGQALKGKRRIVFVSIAKWEKLINDDKYDSGAAVWKERTKTALTKHSHRVRGWHTNV